MMIDKRLLKEMPQSKKYIMQQVTVQWIALLLNIILIVCFSFILQGIYEKTLTNNQFYWCIAIMVITIIGRILCSKKQALLSYEASKDVKFHLRKKIYEKILLMRLKYREVVSTSELVQLSVEGVDQLEIYFGRYLPQFFYSMIAPITLFLIFVWIDYKSALVLFLCVPLIPLSIVAVQKFAKKLLAKYWSIYANLGDSFLDNLQGLTTLKIYQADEQKQKEMQVEAQHFRKITMKVLTMQLNSVTIMDFIAYGGAAIGSIVAILSFQNQTISFGEAICICLLSAEFFLPLRLLGSFFHIAMNGIAASNKIFNLLDQEIDQSQIELFPKKYLHMNLDHVSFSYDQERMILHDVTLQINNQECIAIVGESGSGKSTIAKLLMGFMPVSQGSYTIDGIVREKIKDESFLEHVVYVSHQPFLMKASIKDNLLMGKPDASEEEMYHVLKQVKLYDFVQSEQGLQTPIEENGNNLSGGQKQRLAIARALLKNGDLYIFDEATSNIDVESEEVILQIMFALAKSKGVIMITHRLQSVVGCDRIYVMDQGYLKEQGTHAQLMNQEGVYANLYHTQQDLESYRGGANK